MLLTLWTEGIECKRSTRQPLACADHPNSEDFQLCQFFLDTAPQTFHFLLERNWKSAASITLFITQNAACLPSLRQSCTMMISAIFFHHLPANNVIQGEKLLRKRQQDYHTEWKTCKAWNSSNQVKDLLILNRRFCMYYNHQAINQTVKRAVCLQLSYQPVAPRCPLTVTAVGNVELAATEVPR